MTSVVLAEKQVDEFELGTSVACLECLADIPVLAQPFPHTSA